MCSDVPELAVSALPDPFLLLTGSYKGRTVESGGQQAYR